MEGLFYYHDADSITFLSFYPDGRIISYGKYKRYDQLYQEFPDLWVETDDVLYSRGFCQHIIGNEINIFVKGEYGKMLYRGTIRDENTIDLSFRCPITNFWKSVTFQRYSSEQHIIHIEISDTYPN